jgi:hypothetical protein
MKSINTFIILILLSVLFTSQAMADRDVALILKVAGKAELKTQTSNWKPLKRGARLNGGDQIRTGENTLVALVFTDDKSLMKIRSSSELTIHGTRSKSGIKKRIDMKIGQVWSRVTPGGAGFRIETPTGVAAVKGTDFYTYLLQSGLMEVFGVTGLVELFNNLGKITIGPGQKGVLEKGGKPRFDKTNGTPSWGPLTDDEQEIILEFINDEGTIKYMKLKIQ